MEFNTGVCVEHEGLFSSSGLRPSFPLELTEHTIVTAPDRGPVVFAGKDKLKSKELLRELVPVEVLLQLEISDLDSLSQVLSTTAMPATIGCPVGMRCER